MQKEAKTLSESAFNKKMEEIDKKKQKLVKGRFCFYEVPGGIMRFYYKWSKSDPGKHYKLLDGEICELPLGVVQHLNADGWYPVHENCVDKDGKPSVRIGKKIRRYGFQSLEFTSDDYDTSHEIEPILSVEKI